MSSITDRAENAGQQAHNSEWIDKAARIGLVAYGVVHLSHRLAGRSAGAGRQGGLGGLAGRRAAAQRAAVRPGAGLGARGRDVPARRLAGAGGDLRLPRRGGVHPVRKRATAAGKAVIYVVIGVSAVRAATGSRPLVSQKGGGTDSTTAKVMDWPGGQVIIGAVGLAIIGIGGYLVYRAWTEKFAKHINAEGKSGDTGTAYLWFGKAGYTAKGVTFGIIGVAVPLRRADPRPEEVGWARPGPAQGAAAAVRAGPAGRDRPRPRLLRAVLLRPGQALQRLKRQRGGPSGLGTTSSSSTSSPTLSVAPGVSVTRFMANQTAPSQRRWRARVAVGSL